VKVLFLPPIPRILQCNALGNQVYDDYYASDPKYSDEQHDNKHPLLVEDKVNDLF
jgi:hypothetical protein